jgi:hypothetical protein
MTHDNLFPSDLISYWVREDLQLSSIKLNDAAFPNLHVFFLNTDVYMPSDFLLVFSVYKSYLFASFVFYNKNPGRIDM